MLLHVFPLLIMLAEDHPKSSACWFQGSRTLTPSDIFADPRERQV